MQTKENNQRIISKNRSKILNINLSFCNARDETQDFVHNTQALTYTSLYLMLMLKTKLMSDMPNIIP